MDNKKKGRGIFIAAILAISFFSVFVVTSVSAQPAPTRDIFVANCADSIQRITPAGVATTIASGFTGCPVSIVFDDSGNIMFVGAEMDPTIYRVALDGTVSVFVTGSPLQNPVRLVKDANGNFIVADESAKIIKVTPSGTMSIVASGAPLSQPIGIDIDGSGNYIVADPAANAIFRVTPAGSVTTVASGGLINSPFDVRVDSDGNYIVVNEGNNSIIRVTPGGAVSSVISPIPNAVRTVGLAIDTNGNYLVADQDRPAIYVVTPSGSSGEFLVGSPLVRPVSITLQPFPIAVPEFNTVGLLALIGLLSVIAAMSIKIRKRKG